MIRRTLFALRADAVAAKLLALALATQVKGVRKLARVALFAQAALVVFANQVIDSTAF